MKSLHEQIDDLVSEYFNNYYNGLVHDHRMMDIYSGQIRSEVERLIDLAYSTDETRSRVKNRVPYINLCTRVIDKMSKVYIEGANRVCQNDKDQALVDYYVKALNLNPKMNSSNKMLNLHKRVALEPYMDYKGYPQLRVIPAHMHLPYSSDYTDPCNMTTFVKFVGNLRKKYGPLTRMEDGSQIYSAEYDYRNVKCYYLYTEHEFLVIDNTGAVQTDIMKTFPKPWSEGKNPLGMIPFVYSKLDDFNLVPKPDSDLYSLSVQIPQYLGDLSYAIQYQSHSIIAGIDVDIQDPLNSPDAVWQVNSNSTEEGSSPSIQVISPTVDIPNVLQFIEFLIKSWMASRNIRSGSFGATNADEALSGVAKMIDEMDTTQLRKEQIEVYTDNEYNLWNLIKQIHNQTWISYASIPDELRYPFSDDFEMNVEFPTPQPVLTENEKLEVIKKKKSLNLISGRQALQELHPRKTKEQIEELYREINDENQQDVDQDNDSSEEEESE